MFYNLRRSTKADREEKEKAERLLNFQKRQKLKDWLITKFMQKFGMTQPEQVLEAEITKFFSRRKINKCWFTKIRCKTKKNISK